MKTTNLPALQAAVFDMDGTLLDSMQMWANAPGVLLGRYGVHPPEGFIRRLIPLSARQCAVLMVEEYHLPVTPEQLAEQTAEYTRRQYAEHLQLKPGAKELVERFAARGVPMALASASSIRDVQAAMTRLGLWDKFRAVLTSSISAPGGTFFLFVSCFRPLCFSGGCVPGQPDHTPLRSPEPTGAAPRPFR